ncbi:hypothetical protein PVAP13_2KG325667 [Panicum virgatum]|uniref:Uncharacterized protein n=1 Tax=Panicum virgatum TaxID=38727 RepID=A0A8T0W6C9_PANVG|nr:hypothetical protein PVAP13_2KG325667 [Panicum virgatum]
MSASSGWPVGVVCVSAATSPHLDPIVLLLRAIACAPRPPREHEVPHGIQGSRRYHELERPHQQLPGCGGKVASANLCEVCARSLLDNLCFCSLGCEVFVYFPRCCKGQEVAPSALRYLRRQRLLRWPQRGWRPGIWMMCGWPRVAEVISSRGGCVVGKKSIRRGPGR